VARARDAGLLSVGLAAFAALCWYFGLTDVAVALGRVRVDYLLLYLCGCGAVILGACWRWRMVTAVIGSRQPLRRLVSARLAGDALGSLLPSARLAGDPLRIALLHRRGTAVAEAAAGVAVDRILEIVGNTLCAVTYIAAFLITHAGAPRGSAWVALMTLTLLSLGLAGFLAMLRRDARPLAPLYRSALVRRAPRLRRWSVALEQMEQRLTGFFRDHPRVFVYGVLSSLGIEACAILQYYFLLATFGVHLDFVTLLMALVATAVARVVPTPAGLGALETSQVTVLALAGSGAQVGFVVGIVMRLHETLWQTVGLVVLAVQGVSLSRVRLMAGRKATA
jgi:glycosyltransferase 2 family protein